VFQRLLDLEADYERAIAQHSAKPFLFSTTDLSEEAEMSAERVEPAVDRGFVARSWFL